MAVLPTSEERIAVADIPKRDEPMGVSTSPADRHHARVEHAVEEGVIRCLNEALAMHGGSPLIEDGVSREMSHYVDPSNLAAVLDDARRLARERGLALPRTFGIHSVKTDDDAVSFVVGR